MARRRLSSRTAALVVAGVAGVVLAHGLDYLLVIRSASVRAARLAQTGHGWWPSAVGAAVGATFLALGMAGARGAAGAAFRRAAVGADTSAFRDLGRMVVWQGGLFTAVELVERLAAHQSGLELVHGPLFPVGLVLQAAVALVAVAVLRWLERGVEALATRVLARSALRRPPERLAFLRVALPIGSGTAPIGRHEARGPPLSVVR